MVNTDLIFIIIPLFLNPSSRLVPCESSRVTKIRPKILSVLGSLTNRCLSVDQKMALCISGTKSLATFCKSCKGTKRWFTMQSGPPSRACLSVRVMIGQYELGIMMVSHGTVAHIMHRSSSAMVHKLTVTNLAALHCVIEKRTL